MAEVKLKVGIKDGKPVSIKDVVSGLNCGCICPHCGATLIARKGEVNAHHFAHYDDEDCDKAVESSLHLWAKSLISQSEELMFPAYVNGQFALPAFKEHIIDVRLEEWQENSYRPDCIATYLDNIGIPHQVWIEIKVTHPVTEEKLSTIKREHIECIEIDLSKLYNGKLSFEEAAESEILYNAENRRWVNPPQVFLDCAAQMNGELPQQEYSALHSQSLRVHQEKEQFESMILNRNLRGHSAGAKHLYYTMQLGIKKDKLKDYLEKGDTEAAQYLQETVIPEIERRIKELNYHYRF